MDYGERDIICENISVSENGTLFFAGQDTLKLAEKYGTPLYLMDEQRIRNRCRTYKNAVKKAFGENARVLYASKAASFKRMYEIIAEEGLGTDVVSLGEIYTAEKAGFDLSQAFFHSNGKTDEDIKTALEKGIGYFVVDNTDELYALSEEAVRQGKTQKILLRITPGIDPHTYAAISTGKVDSKFGSAIETGAADDITALALSLDGIKLEGFHCHVGSQVFDSEVYLKTSDVMLSFAAHIRQKFSREIRMLDLGGGYGVRYTGSQPLIDIEKNILRVGQFIKEKCAALGMAVPEICFEPGRSIAADAGMTLYTVTSVKKIPGYKTYIAVDGGMADNIRYALYKAPYTVLPAGNMTTARDTVVTVAGRCCESGDIIQENVSMPSGIKRGDILACLTTGAYHYSMASNYNRLAKPATEVLNGSDSYIAVKKETFEDILRNDI